MWVILHRGSNIRSAAKAQACANLLAKFCCTPPPPPPTFTQPVPQSAWQQTISTHVHVTVSVCVCMHVSVCVCMHVSVCVCVCVCM